MRGRSPYNKPTIRKKELYELLLKIGGESRWKNLKQHLKELGWGPTTLKRTLDQMIKDKTIKKEARLGKKGAEIWYKIITETDLLLLQHIIWKPSIEFKEPKGPFENWIENIQKNANQLEGTEKEDFLRKNLHPLIVGMAMLIPIIKLLLTLRTSKIKNFTKSETVMNFELGFDYMVKRPQTILLNYLLEYPEYSMEIIDQILREPYSAPTVSPRSMKEFIKSGDLAQQWIKSNYKLET